MGVVRENKKEKEKIMINEITVQELHYIKELITEVNYLNQIR